MIPLDTVLYLIFAAFAMGFSAGIGHVYNGGEAQRRRVLNATTVCRRWLDAILSQK